MNLPGVIENSVSRNALRVQKASPELLLAAGIVGTVASTVLACRATLKMNTLLEETKKDLEVARTMEHPDYSEKDRSRDISLIYVQGTVKVIRLYAPAAVLGIASISALIASNRILKGRTVALAAAYSALDRGFKEYRARVVEKYGEDEDRYLRYGTQKVQITDPETGKKRTVTRAGPGAESIYARFFDESSRSWNKEPEYNLIFLQAQQNYWNDRLQTRGHVFLNEVYEDLGLIHSKAGAVVGWLWDPDDPNRDNFIDFGIFNDRTEVRDFVNGFEGSILLDFNVDGVIYDMIDDR